MTDLIEVNGLIKRFKTNTALDGVDFAVAEGTVLGLLGPNGAGKTTAVRILATLLRADGGTARVAGYDVAIAGRQGAGGRRPHRAVRRRRRIPDRGREPGNGRPALSSRSQGIEGRAATICSSDSTWPTRPTGRRRRIPVVCGDGWTSPRRSLPGPGCFSSTNRPPDSTRGAGWACGSSSPISSPTERPSCSPRSTWKRPTDWPTTWWSSITVKVIARGTGDALKAQVGGQRLEFTVAEASLATLRERLQSIAADAGRRSTKASRTRQHAGQPAAPRCLSRGAWTNGGAPDIELVDVGLRRPDLDDVFLTLTGHGAEDADAADAVDKKSEAKGDK